jgi:hypothetical protein
MGLTDSVVDGDVHAAQSRSGMKYFMDKKVSADERIRTAIRTMSRTYASHQLEHSVESNHISIL